MFRTLLSRLMAVVAVCGGSLLAEDAPEGADPLNPNVEAKTLGGRQFWADVAFFHDWRIQKNVASGHYRLLDGRDVRHAWGTREQCQMRLDQIRKEKDLPKMKGEGVVLLHGIARSSKTMKPLAKELAKAGYATFAVDYPSTRVPIEDSADSLAEVIQSLEGIEKIHLIGFSMGGLVARSYLQRYPHERVGRVLLIGTPNNGADMARLFGNLTLYKWILGPAGQQLTSAEEGVAAKLAKPDVEFGVIAGARGDGGGFNPLIDGDDDGTVTVESVRLSGAADFATVPALHFMIPSHPETLSASVRFLKEGRFREEGKAQPIP